VKQSLTGSGAAEKRQVQRMVQVSLRLAIAPAQDASDALALAICHAQAARLVALGAGRSARRGRSRASTWVVRRAR
jgi:crossover junction endodeoxyribonuclease RuvC